MDLDTLKNQLNTTESQMSQYTSNLPSEIQTEVQKAYTPLLQESLGVTKNLMSDYLGRYFDVTGMGPGTQGTSAVDLSPSQKLGVMGRELGTMSGNLQASQKYSDYLGAQMNDLYGKAVQASQLGYQNLADQYARQMQQYQLAWQAAEAEKDRQASIRAAKIAAGAYGSYGGTTETGTGNGNIVEVDDPEVTPREKRADNMYAAGMALTSGKDFANKLVDYYSTAKWNALNPIYAIGAGTVAVSNMLKKNKTTKTPKKKKPSKGYNFSIFN